MSIGTFDSFTAARMGIYSAQHGLRVTGNNISNINTDRYTRQRADQVSFKTGASDRYASWLDNHVGNGSLVTGISQIRDPFLDIRYRTTATDTYYYDSKLSSLQDIASILDEVGRGNNDGDGMIYAQLQDLLKQLRAFSANPTSGNDGLVRESANSLASLFRHYAGKLDELYENTKTYFNDSITQVNEILTNIRDLNESIREAEIHGDLALEMRDERNRQIDELAKYTSIRVEYSYEDVGAGIQVEKLTISMDNSNPDPSVKTDSSVLVDGLYATQLSVPEQKPVLNSYRDQPGYENYLYLKEYTPTNNVEFQEFLNSLGLTSPDQLVQATNADGTPKPGVYLVGTNDAAAEGIVTEKNDNYTVQLSQLLDKKGNVWEGTTTTWTELEGTPVLKYRYGFKVSGSGLSVGDTFGVAQAGGGEITFTVVENTKKPLEEGEIYLADVQNSTRFAKFIAEQLQASGRYDDDYEITSKGGQIIFTATTPNKNEAPDFKVTPADTTLVTAEPVDPPLDPEVTYDPPADIDPADYPIVTTDEYGTTTTVKYTEVNGRYYLVTIETRHSYEIALDDNDLHGILQAQREMLTEEGEFASAKDVAIDENACIKRGIPYYINSLDLLAQKLAEAYNELNTGYKVDQDGNYLTKDNMYLRLGANNEPVNKNKPLTKEQVQALVDLGDDYKKLLDNDSLTADQLQELEDNGSVTLADGTIVVLDDEGNAAVADLDAWLEDKEVSGAVPMGGPLFSNRNDGNDTTGINAHNIDISAGWSNGAWGVIPKFEVLLFAEGVEDLEHTTQNVNADHMVSLLQDKALTYDPRDLHGFEDAIGPKMFEGTFNDMLSNMMGIQAEDARITNVRLITNSISLTDLDYSREGVSGVDLNDEAMNMITYQKAMNAAMRLMTAIDEALDRLINNTGIAGR